MSLAKEEQERNGSAATGKRRALNREVSMSRVFKGKKKEVVTEKKAGLGTARTGGVEKEKAPMPRNDKGVTLVAATPVKSRSTSASRSMSRSMSTSIPQPRLFSASASTSQDRIQGGAFTQKGEDEGGEDEDDWGIQSSPDILLLGSSGTSGATDDWEDGMEIDEGEERMTAKARVRGR